MTNKGKTVAILQVKNLDGSDLYVRNSAPKIGDKVTLKVRVPNDFLFEKAMLRIYHDGEVYFSLSIICSGG